MNRDSNKTILALLSLLIGVLGAREAHAMHLADGILPLSWSGLWFLIALPFVAFGLRDLRKRASLNPLTKPKVALTGAAIFIISCMPIPIPGLGATSHACGTGIAALLIGPHATVVIASIALLFQALFLAHGGLTTLGAGIFSMGVVGAYVGYGAFLCARRCKAPVWVGAFLAGALADWATYGVTAFQLSVAIKGAEPLGTVMKVVILAFLPTQLPIGLFEGALAAGAYTFVMRRRPELLAFSAAHKGIA